MKKGLLIAGVFILITLIVFITYFVLNLSEDTEKQIIDEWEGYVLLENASEYEQELFSLLKEEKELEGQAELFVKLFLANFYSLQLASSKNDVRGVQFVYEPFQESLRKQAREFVYAQVENNFFGCRKQNLNLVKQVEVVLIETSSFTIEESNIEFDSFIVKGQIHYEVDPGYFKDFEVEIIDNDGRLEIVAMDSFISN